MIERMLPNRERLDHLLADRALFGLSQRDHFGLESLVANFPETDSDCFNCIAACVDLALGPSRFGPMSDSLHEVIRRKAAGHLWPNSMGISDATTE